MYNHKQSVKEVIRHLSFRCGLAVTHDMVRRWHGRRAEHMRMKTIPDIFSKIYEDNVWVEKMEQENLSGVGSTKDATSDLVVQLASFLRDVECRQLVDIGCGDFNWMQNVEGDFNYLGIDVVPQLIEAHQARYANDKRRFICMDATLSAIPSGDVAICREVLFHLSFRDGLLLLNNIKAAGFKYVLLTHDVSIWFNSDIRSGDFRLINLTISPYRLCKPMYQLRDEKVSVGRTLSVWPGEVLPG
jgi:hypothetical protein